MRFWKHFNIYHASQLFDRLSRVSTWCTQWFGLLVKLPLSTSFEFMEEFLQSVFYAWQSAAAWLHEAASAISEEERKMGAAAATWLGGSNKMRLQDDEGGGWAALEMEENGLQRYGSVWPRLESIGRQPEAIQEGVVRELLGQRNMEFILRDDAEALLHLSQSVDD
ncbi:hypothetical protein BHM03_00038937 [Ensete ventricosum]|nr:hypothetical protein BHM03_00038937 [Ensete ventricosum]